MRSRRGFFLPWTRNSGSFVETEPVGLAAAAVCLYDAKRGLSPGLLPDPFGSRRRTWDAGGDVRPAPIRREVVCVSRPPESVPADEGGRTALPYPAQTAVIRNGTPSSLATLKLAGVSLRSIIASFGSPVMVENISPSPPTSLLRYELSFEQLVSKRREGEGRRAYQNDARDKRDHFQGLRSRLAERAREESRAADRIFARA